MTSVAHASVNPSRPDACLCMCLMQGVDMSEDEVAVVMATIDEDGGGDIDLGEFTNWFLGLDKKQEGEKISKIGT